MKKIPSLFVRNFGSDHLVRDEVNPEAAWVVNGEGRATRKWDGACCMVRDRKLYKRYTLKRGKTPPADFEPVTEVNEHTGKQEGWRPVGDGGADKWFREAFAKGGYLDGTYELIGPKVNGNPEGQTEHVMVPHGMNLVPAPRTFADLREWLKTAAMEGVVWWNDDGRMAKIKAKDFGIPWPPEGREAANGE